MNATISGNNEITWKSVVKVVDQWIDSPPMPGFSEGPTDKVLALVRVFAECAHARNLAQPTRIVPNGHGGILIEREIGIARVSFTFDKDGSVTSRMFVSGEQTYSKQVAAPLFPPKPSYLS